MLVCDAQYEQRGEDGPQLLDDNEGERAGGRGNEGHNDMMKGK